MLNQEQFDDLLTQAHKEMNGNGSRESLFNRYLGRRGLFSDLIKQIGNLPTDQRQLVGEKAQLIKNQLTLLLSEKNEGQSPVIDLSLPANLPIHGHQHPIDFTISRLYDLSAKLGFVPSQSPEVESEDNNFEFLQVAKDHPARDMQDTFWTTDGRVLRTQTTAFQQTLIKNHLPPFAFVNGGKIYRCEAEDATHLSEFHQFDGFAVAKGLTFADLKGTLLEIIQMFFERQVEIRFRPAFFPFVEPGAEIDMKCLHCNGTGCQACGYKGWLELLGCGMTHPKIIEAADLDPNQYHGLAFGFGVERFAMLYYGLKDIREFTRNDPRFLEQLV